jgi:DNA-binding transcriptional regulator YhcF (GntR family)
MRQLKYNQAQFAILNLVSELNIKVGERLPPERQLIKSLDCSTITMRSALAKMKSLGIIEGKRGSGNFLLKKIDNNIFIGKILRVSIYKENENTPGISTARPQHYLAKQGIGMTGISVHRFDRDLITAARDCMGIILSGWLTEEFLEQIKTLNLPVIICGNTELKTDLPCISLDFKTSAYRLTKIFIEAGCRKIAVFTGTEDYVPGHQQRRGYIKAMSEAGLPYEPYIAPPSKHFRGYERISEFMRQQHCNVDAIIMEHLTLEDFICWCWGNDYPEKPKIGIVQTSIYKGYHQSPDIMWACFTDAETICAKKLSDYIIYGKTMRSQTLAPFIHGIDDNNIDFVN